MIIYITWDNGEKHRIRLSHDGVQAIANKINELIKAGEVYAHDVMVAGELQCGAGDLQCALEEVKNKIENSMKPMSHSVHGDATVNIENLTIKV